MSLPRVLVATPVYSGATVPYVLGLAETMRDVKDYELIPSMTRATYVQVGRDVCVAEARKLKCDKLLFWDSDIGASAALVSRILGHQKPVVGGVYTKRVAGEAQWTFYATGEPYEGELVPVNNVATGFMAIDVGIFTQLDRFLGVGEGELSYFPVQRVEKGGWKSPESVKLDAIAAILSDDLEANDAMDVLAEIRAVMRRNGLPSEVIGDDCSFVRLCKAAGVPVFADLGCVLRHYGEIGFPAKEV